ncbi:MULTISPECIES: Hpt domain-containing protein [unclassified Psychrobacter]|uniref:Hpt domain-containing protein n=1 Tax=unclassified Psychrobacter TaxID=196806 RepID=UPI0025B49435|nr:MULTISPECIES: Hpt domain-containing protein [unclassified Psychrobacter]MDN3453748.1 Hpt domain-containing protein [Psychrobacter sp. APC 3350]MDN3503542.1 Hpt domain-containing protein [Psychrobacter sp. 5A.1]
MDENTNKNITKQAEEVINHEQFEDMRELLEEDFSGLIQVYIADSKQRVVTLRTAQRENDNANGFEIAHALKGASANLGTVQLANLSSQLQEQCRERRIGEQAVLIEEIAIALHRAEQEINLRLGQ